MSEKLIKQVPEGLIEELDKKFAERVAKIQASKSDWRVYGDGKIYYVANHGDDNNDGLSEERPIQTLDEVMKRQNSGDIKLNDVVLLNRGNEWHCKFFTTQGVTYSAYGNGKKPRVLGSVEADGPEQWIKTDAENVYAFTGKLKDLNDVGNIVFNDGQCYGMRVLPLDGMTMQAGIDYLVSNGLNRWTQPPRPFNGYYTLSEIGAEIPESDLMFYHDWKSETLYLYSREGNPGERFFSVELCTYGHAIVAESDVTIDNLCVRYSGAHGISAGTCRNLTVRNCEVGWIGGCVQAPDVTKPERVKIRYGNAVEIYGAADGYYVHDCFMHQCFDCGPTVQVGIRLPEGKKVHQRNIAFYGNALREAALEIWMTSHPKNTEDTFARLENCRMFDNYVTKSGYGWKGYNHNTNREFCIFYGADDSDADYIGCYMEDNYFWNMRVNVMKASPTSIKNGIGFHWRNNTIIKKYGTSFGFLGSDLANAKGYVRHMYTEESLQRLTDESCMGANTYYYIPEDSEYDPTDKIPNPFG